MTEHAADHAADRAVDLHVTGRVQGVAFRASCQQEAERLGVTGWVRNEPDGSVVAHAEGEREAVDALVDWCRHGPSGADVDSLDVTEASPTGAVQFRVGY